MILVALLYAILASTFIFAKQALMYAKPFFLIGVRMISAGLVLLTYQYVTNKKSLSIARKDYATFLRVSLFHVYLAFILEFWALQYVSALKTTMLYSTTPFIAAILSYVLLQERLSKAKIAGIVIGIGGIIPVLLAQAGGVEASTEIFSLSLPEMVLFAAVISAAYAWFIVSELMKKGYPLGMINGVAMLVGGLMSMVTAYLVEGFTAPVKDLWPFLGWLSLLILSANIIVYNFYAWLIKRYTITFVTFSGFLCPSFGTIYEWLFLGGVITWHYPASLILVTIGLYVFHKDELALKFS